MEFFYSAYPLHSTATNCQLAVAHPIRFSINLLIGREPYGSHFFVVVKVNHDGQVPTMRRLHAVFSVLTSHLARLGVN